MPPAARNPPAGASAATWYDSDADCTEDFGDFAVLAALWPAPRGFKDLALFAAQWLKDTSLTEDVRYDAGEIVLPAN